VFDVITGVARSELPDTARNFLRTVIDNGRINALPEVAAQFRALVNRRNGSSDAIVYSAFPMDAAALGDVSAALEKRFGRKLNLTDPAASFLPIPPPATPPQEAARPAVQALYSCVCGIQCLQALDDP